MRKFLLLMCTLFAGIFSFAQNINNYAATTNNNGSLVLDMNGNAIDMSTGTTELPLAGTTGVYHDDDASVVTNIGFSIVFMGNTYDRFSVNSNGQMKLGSATDNTAISGGAVSSPLASTAILAAITGDNSIQATGKIHYRVFGSAPARILVVEFVGFRIPLSSSAGTLSQMQIRLYEGTNIIEYVYGTMYNNSSSTSSRTVGISSSNSATTSAYFATITTTPTFTASSTWSTSSFAANSNMTNLHGASDGSRRYFRFTPPAVPAAASGVNFTAIGVSQMTINWTDNSSNEAGFRVYRSTDNINFTLVATAAAGATSSVQTGLSGSTQYFWRIVAFNEGGESSAASGDATTTACSFSGTKTIGASGADYTTLASAISAMQIAGLSGPVVFELQADYVPESNISLPFITCVNSTNTITIRPAASVAAPIVFTSATANTFDFSGGQWYIIDGRPGGSGTSKMITIANTNASGPALRFINDASNNVVRYATLQSVNTTTSSGTIVFSTAASGGTGNDNNLIENNDIRDGASTPLNAIFSSGSTASTAANNSGIQILNNNIFNFFNASSASQGVNVSSGSTDWTVSGNSFYQTAARTVTGTSLNYAVISINTGNNYQVTNNFIGGSSSNAGGTAWTVSGSSNRFWAIHMAVGSTTASTVNGNVINNITQTSTSAVTTGGTNFSGIYVSAGTVNIGTGVGLGNTVGSTTGTGIVLTSSSTGAFATGINFNSGANGSANYNTVAGISVNGSSTSVSYGFRGIWAQSMTGFTCTNNTIGSTTMANSIHAATASVNATTQEVTGILSASTGTVNISSNIIANLNNAYVPSSANTSSLIRGIVSTAGSNTITGNTVRNLSIAANGTGTGSSASVIGISMTSTTSSAVVLQNTVHSLANNGTGNSSVTGIWYGGPTTGSNLVARNFIHSLTAGGTGATLNGIAVGGGTTTFQNNMIRLGIDATGNPITTALAINGILETVGTDNFYFNSVYIGGTGVGTTASNSFAFNSSVTTNTRIFRNNIFVNVRNNATTGGKHYAVRVGGSSANPTGLTLNNNIYYASGTGTFLGLFNSVDQADLAAWKTAVGQDAASFSGDPMFVAPTGNATTVDLHIQTGVATLVEGNGANIASVTDDYDGQARSGLTPEDIGADAGNFTAAGDAIPPVITYTAVGSTCSTADRVISGVTITDAVGIPTAGGNVPRIWFRNGAGAWSSNAGSLTSGDGLNGIWSFSIPAASLGTINVGDVISYYILAQDNAGNLTASPGTGFAGTDVNTVTTHPSNANTYVIGATLNGAYTVGAGGNYTTIGAAASAYNNGCLAGPVVFNLIDAAYTGETFPITIGANPGASSTNTLTIKATQANTTLSGSSASAIFVLNAADYVTINGSASNTANTVCPPTTASRDLTVTNTNSGTSSAVIWIQSNGSDGATNNAIRNLLLVGNSTTTTQFGVGMGGSMISATSLGNGNNNNTIENNDIQKTRYGIYSQGASAASKNTGNMILLNRINAASPNNVGDIGIIVGFENNITITGNRIANLVVNGTTTDAIGIMAGGVTNILASTTSSNEVTNANITKNVIDNFQGSSTYSAAGIWIGAATSGTTTIANNMISRVNSNGTSGDYAVGIFVGGGTGSTTNIWYNTVDMTRTLTGGGQPSIALGIGGSNPVASVRNNILTSTGSTGANQNRAIALAYALPASNLTSDNNNLFVSGTSAAIGQTGGLASGTNHTTFANWTTNSSKDAASKNILPAFVSSIDMHLQQVTGNADLNGTGALVGVGDDIDCEARDGSTPDIGADEFTIPACSGSNGGTATAPTTAYCVTGAPTITASGYATGLGITYQWQSSTDNTNWNDIAGQNNPATLTLGAAVTTTTHYRLSVTCSATSTTGYSTTVTITINPLPTITVTPPSGAYCVSGSVNLTASGADTYSWSPATGLSATTGATVTASPSVTTTYTVTGTVTATGCFNTANVTIAVNPNPSSITVTPSSATICANGPAQQLTANGGTISGSVTSGTGGSTTSGSVTTSSLGPNPLQNYYGGTKQQWIYRAAELTTLGLPANAPINSIRINLGTANTTYALQNLVIKMKHATTASYASLSSWETGLTTVRSAASFTPTGTGLNTITLDNPFSWNGTDNLIVEISYSNNNTGTSTTNNTARFTTTSFTSTLFYRTDDATAATMEAFTGSASFSYSARTDVVFNYSIPTNITWSPTTGLFTDAAATTAYTGGAATSVYALPSSNTTYTVTATSASGCTNTQTVAVNVTAAGTWNGSTSSDWFTAANWCGGIPTSTTDVVIPAGVPNMPVIANGTAAARNITVNATASLNVNNTGGAGILNIYGNLVNNGTFDATTGSLAFMGSSSQTTAGFTAGDVTVDGAGVTLNGNATVNGNLTLTSGNVTLGANNLTLSNSATGSNTAHLVVNGAGRVVLKNLSAAMTAPVGTDASSYNPVTITPNAGHTMDDFTIGIMNGVFASGTTGAPLTTNVVDRTWLIDEAVAGGSDVNITVQWTATQELSGFARTSCYVMHYIGGSWSTQATGAAAGSDPYTRTRTNVTSFSPFAVQSQVGTGLPVTFYTFSGVRDGNRNLLKWTTQTEQNNRGFEVQRSTDGRTYSTLGFVNSQAPNGNSTASITYSFTDNSIAGSKQYYRLRQVDLDNRAKLSNVVLISGSKPLTLALGGLFPNPAVSKLQVLVEAPAREVLTLMVTDVSGKVVLTRRAPVETGSNTLDLQVDALAAGTYLLKVVCNTGCESTVGKFVKQ